MDLHDSRMDKGALAKSKIINIECILNDVNELPEDTLGKRVKKARIGKKLDIKQLSKICGISQEAISNIEHERNQPYVSTLNKLCNALAISNRYLLGADVWPENTPGQIIKKYRLINGWTQRQLAEKCKLHQSTIKDYEDDRLKGNSGALSIIYKVIGYKVLLN